MSENQQVPLMITIPKECRDKLRTMAAKNNLNNLDKVTTASSLAKEIVCKYLDRLEGEERRVQ